MPNRETKLQPGLFDLPDFQPGLFDLPETRSTTDDFLTPDGKKKSTIPTGMPKPEIKKLNKNKAKRRSRSDPNWPNEY